MHLRRLLNALAAVSILAFLASCSSSPATSGDAASDTPMSSSSVRILWMGDSIAVGQAVPLAQAFDASAVHFQSLAAEGGGNVVGPFSEEKWQTLPQEVKDANPTTVVYQITTYDWGTAEEQRAGYERLLETTSEAGANLVMVSMPPIRPDDFYAPHIAELAQASRVAQEVAAGSGGRATFLDAEPVWGEDYLQVRDGTPDRSSDGIHTCPQGAARFANWLVQNLSAEASWKPAPAARWATSGWSADPVFLGC